MIRLENINKSYSVGQHALHVLEDVDLVVETGEMVAIMGASGSGKSTLLNILGLLDRYDSGAYYLDNTLMRGLSENKAAFYRNRFIGFVFQSFHLLPFKTAVENVALPLYYQGVSRRQRNRKAMDYLERVGLADWAGHLPSELSGGQKQRVAIARSLITEPRIILADEPTGALDSATTLQIMGLLEEVHRAGMTVVVVTHEPDIGARTDRIIRLRDGRVISTAASAHDGHAEPGAEPDQLAPAASAALGVGGAPAAPAPSAAPEAPRA